MAFSPPCGMIPAMVGLDDMMKACRRAIAAALLFVIAIHAALPMDQPLERGSGSAFSAATAEVSLGSSPSLSPAKRVVPLAPTVLPPQPRTLRPAAVAITGPLAPRVRPPATGPPASDTVFSPLAPRAPPAA